MIYEHFHKGGFTLEFNVNSPLLYVLAGIVIAFVLAQSVFFLVRALKRAKELGIDLSLIRRTVASSAVFTVAPAVAIVISVIALSKDLGIPLPWLRLSVVGSLTYETVAATNAESAMGLTFGQVESLTASQYVTIALVMTIGISVGIWLVALIGKKVQNGMLSIEKRDKKWSEIFNNAMFIGMISAFLGYVFCDVTNVIHGDTAGLIPVAVMVVSALAMALCGLLVAKLKYSWIQDYALPISLLLGMASAIPLTNWLG